MKKTGVSSELHARPRRGVSVFAPSNAAWEALGPDLKSFLFSSQGLKYLTALVRYHIVVGGVIYSDDLGSGVGEDKAGQASEPGRRGFQTLLGGANVSMDVSRKNAALFRVNGNVVSVRDMPARDGVVHVLDKVLFPPHPDDGEDNRDVQMRVDDVKKLLDALIETEQDGSKSSEL